MRPIAALAIAAAVLGVCPGATAADVVVTIVVPEIQHASTGDGDSCTVKDFAELALLPVLPINEGDVLTVRIEAPPGKKFVVRTDVPLGGALGTGNFVANFGWGTENPDDLCGTPNPLAVGFEGLTGGGLADALGFSFMFDNCQSQISFFPRLSPSPLEPGGDIAFTAMTMTLTWDYPPLPLPPGFDPTLRALPPRATDPSFGLSGFADGPCPSPRLEIVDAAPPPTLVTIDIWPYLYPNVIKLGSRLPVPVAVFSSASFDATTIDVSTLTLAEAHVKLLGRWPLATDRFDLNGDGRLDLLALIDTQALELSVGDTTATLEGQTFDGTSFAGSDTVLVKP